MMRMNRAVTSPCPSRERASQQTYRGKRGGCAGIRYGGVELSQHDVQRKHDH
jgi:hypothetical protein